MSHAALGLPDTKLVTEALAVARRALAAPIVSHSLRAFMLAGAYAKGRRRRSECGGAAHELPGRPRE